MHVVRCATTLVHTLTDEGPPGSSDHLGRDAQVGFLYLRYTCNPRQLWQWMQPYIEDREVSGNRECSRCGR